MLAALVVLLRTLGLLCSGHRAVALENVALRQQLSVLRRTVRRPRLRTRDRLFWVLFAKAWQDWRTVSLDNIASGQKSLTLAQYLAILCVPMRHAVPAVGAIQVASSIRRELLLECLALRHQLGVLARTNRRFRP